MSNSASLTVTPLPASAPAITAQPAGVTLQVDATAAFTVAASGTAPLNYQWRVNGAALPDGTLNAGPCIGAIASGAQTASLMLAKVPLSCSGAQVTVAISNPAGNVVSNAAALLVRAVNAFAPICTGPNRTGWCWANPRPLGDAVFAVSFFGNTGLAVAEPEHIFRTTDAGQTWTGVFYAPNARLLDVASPSDSVRIAVGDRILRSTDGGVTWTQVYGPNAKLRAVAFASPTLGFAVSDSGGATLRTTDGGATWSPQGPAGNGIAFASSTVGIVVSDAIIWRTADGGATWQSSGNPVAGRLNAVAYQNANTVVVVGESGFLRSTDGGATWTPLQQGTALNLTRVAFSPGTNFGVATAAGRIYQTTDGGQFWGPVIASMHSSMASRSSTRQQQLPLEVPATSSAARLRGLAGLRSVIERAATRAHIRP